jgi:hypothetical protein
VYWLGSDAQCDMFVALRSPARHDCSSRRGAARAPAALWSV